MGKRDGFDAVADAHEVAEHNINPYYWINKVTSYTYARWMAEKKVAVIALPMYVILLAVVIRSIVVEAHARGVSLWRLLLDDSSGLGPAAAAQVLLMTFFTAVAFIMVVQLLSDRRSKRPTTAQPARRRKQRPPRRKDWR